MDPNKLYSIPLHFPFLKTLAQALLNPNYFSGVFSSDLSVSAPDQLWNLAQYQIFLPTRRACQQLESHLFEENNFKLILMPRIIPLGEIEEDEIALTSVSGLNFIASSQNLISSQRRHLLLTSLISKFSYESQVVPFNQAYAFAAELIKLIDDLQKYEVPLDKLKALNPHLESAEHWQKIMKFFHLISDHWPKILESENKIEPFAWRTLVMDFWSTEWQSQPPSHPVIIAGSMGTIPATDRLMKAVLSLKKGMVILPGFEDSLEQAGISTLSPSHPYYQPSQLLKLLDISPASVQQFFMPPAPDYQSASDRALFLKNSFNNQAAPSKKDQKPFENFQLIECLEMGEESQVIAFHIREFLENNIQPVVFISPCPDLSKRVITELKRWKIEYPEGAECSYLKSSFGSFLELTSQWLESQFTITNFLSTLKHPLLAQYHSVLYDFEKYVLRQPKENGIGFSVSAFLSGESIQAFLKDKFKSSDVKEVFQAFLNLFYSLESFLKVRTQFSNLITFKDCLIVHENLLKLLLETDNIFINLKNPIMHQTVWETLKEAALNIPLNAQEYSNLLRSILENTRTSPSPLNAPLSILSPLEARLVQGKAMILGGLNDNSWPLTISSDPFFSPVLRETLGLPKSDAVIGQSAHDFMYACCAPHVLLTRSRRVDGVPTVPSKFLSRLKATTRFYDTSFQINDSRTFGAFLKQLPLRQAYSKLLPPCPRPPINLRPKKLSITDIKTLMEDPYSIYAKHILKLKPLEPLEYVPGHREYGIFLHEFLNRQYVHLNSKSPDQILKETEALFNTYFVSKAENPFWWIKFTNAVDWVRQAQKLLLVPFKIHQEIWGTLEFDTHSGPFHLVGKADRLDEYEDGVTLIDYKTGYVPFEREFLSGKYPQLPLEAAILKWGNFKNLPRHDPLKLEIWSLSSASEMGEIITYKQSADQFADQAFQGLKNLITEFLEAQTPYFSHPRSNSVPSWNNDSFKGPYDHLARVKEWTSNFNGL